ncbi:putative ornithine decarboxylase [Lactobacillus sp.]|uniref:putative ornithine decarboxylase n=1 Tax=Lactobacillus sp. TaxID=1591 RepID=UPI00199B085D|nr:putative ornithine decarboxylase [Lactobacillus sp.]MBD5429467.1 putative ornithine decarboxylase [Lactobacillus sp.]
MNFLKIAIGNDIKINDADISTESLSNHINAAQLAAIVLKQDDQAAFTTAKNLQQTSGLPIPIISVNNSQLNKEDLKKIKHAAQTYIDKMVPGFLTDLINFAQDQPISFTTPGHHNGQYYDKHPAGALFNNFFGKNLMYADTSDTVPELGDTMTHDGTPLSAEQKAAQTYNADKVYFCTNGTTSSNSICANALLTEGDLVLFDRNNHKSLYNSALVMTGAKPVYIPTDRNPLGLIGEMDPAALSEKNIRKQIAKVAPQKAQKKRPFRLAIVQADTYDGIFYNAQWIIDKIGKLCDYILFDSAWAGFEQFMPLTSQLSPLNLKYGPDDPGILVTQSLHKQQAGLAQTSQILKKDAHIKGQKRYVDHKHFNHAYLKFVTSSYSYPLYASLTSNAYITAGSSNRQWWDEVVCLGIKWRKQLLKKSKLFRPFVPDNFGEISINDLATSSKYWQLNPNETWHGFQKIAKGEAMLDPTKITVITPGINISKKKYEATGIPAPIVSEFLMEKRIIRAKGDLNSILFLLTPGDSEAELNILLDAFLEFEELYNKDVPLKKVMPKLAQTYSDRYKGYTLKQLCQEMHNYYKDSNTFTLQQELFAKSNMQNYTLLPKEADTFFIKNESELVDLSKVQGRIAAEGALPYPPGVFIVAPGEKWGAIDQKYFEVLVGAIERFPGFVPEIQGVYWNQSKDGKISVQAEVLK